MILYWKSGQNVRSGFSLLEVLMALTVFAMVISGIIYGYVQMNRMATWSTWSLAAQSCASQGLEQARAAQWYANGGKDQWAQNYAITNGSPVIPVVQTNTLDVPSSGDPILVTNNIWVTTWSVTPPIRQIRSDCVWYYPLTHVVCTNTVISLRAPDQ